MNAVVSIGLFTVGLATDFAPWVVAGVGIAVVCGRLLWPAVFIDGSTLTIRNTVPRRSPVDQVDQVVIEELPPIMVMRRRTVTVDFRDGRRTRCWALMSNNWPLTGQLFFWTNEQLERQAELLNDSLRPDRGVKRRQLT